MLTFLTLGVLATTCPVIRQYYTENCCPGSTNGTFTIHDLSNSSRFRNKLENGDTLRQPLGVVLTELTNQVELIDVVPYTRTQSGMEVSFHYDPPLKIDLTAASADYGGYYTCDRIMVTLASIYTLEGATISWSVIEPSEETATYQGYPANVCYPNAAPCMSGGIKLIL
jgi:hypothetical protein